MEHGDTTPITISEKNSGRDLLSGIPTISGIDTILWDLGNVLVKGGNHRSFFARSGLEYGQKGQALWDLYKAGQISEMDFWRKALHGTHLQGKEEQVAKQIREGFLTLSEPEEGFIYLPKLKAEGYRLAVLSNHVNAWAHPVVEKLEIHQFCDPILISEKIRLAKPHEQAFRYALDRISRTHAPDRVLFIDDKIANIETAQRLGMNVIQFNGKESLENGFKRYGVMDTDGTILQPLFQ